MISPKILFLALATLLILPVAVAQEGAKPVFAYTIGTAKSRDGFNSYAVMATAPALSPTKGQQLKFAITRSGAAGREAWSYFMIATGRSKSLAQVQGLIVESLRKFPSAAPGTVLGKIGDIKYGGEVRLTVRGANEFVFDYEPALSAGNPRLTREDAAAFVQILGK